MFGKSVTPKGAGTTGLNGGGKDPGHLADQGKLKAPAKTPDGWPPQSRIAQAMALVEAEARQSAIRECVTWLAGNHSNYKPEFLAENLAYDMGAIEQS